MGLSLQFEKVPCGLYTSKSGIVMGNQGRWRRSGWSGLSRTNNLELDQLADQLELHYIHTISGRSRLHVHFRCY